MTDDAGERISLARLLREAAGVSAADWVFSSGEAREEIHDHGLRTLVAAAGHDFTEWEALPEQERSGVLLSGAAKLGITTDWEGWS